MIYSMPLLDLFLASRDTLQSLTRAIQSLDLYFTVNSSSRTNRVSLSSSSYQPKISAAEHRSPPMTSRQAGWKRPAFSGSVRPSSGRLSRVLRCPCQYSSSLHSRTFLPQRPSVPRQPGELGLPETGDRFVLICQYSPRLAGGLAIAFNNFQLKNEQGLEI